LIEILIDRPETSAVFILDGDDEPVAVISSNALSRQLAKPFVRDLYARRSIAETVGIWQEEALRLPAELPLAEAVGRALEREGFRRYEPIVVTAADRDPVLVDVARLFLTQSELQAAAAVALRRAQRVLEKAASEDSLTGLPNRRSFHERVSRSLRARRAGDARVGPAVLFLDFDRFKWVNDSLGHDAGDELLKSIARRLLDAIRQTDALARPIGQDPEHGMLAARIGGDEFLVLLEDMVRPRDAAVVAGRLLAVLDPPHHISGHEVHSTASIGIAIAPPAEASERTDPKALAEQLLRNADLAMYRAKAQGGARFALFDEDMHARAVFRLRAEALLHNTVEAGELRLLYQPIVDLRTGKTQGFEALMRWESPALGPLSPDTFIPLAQETGAIHAMTRWALDTACEDLPTLRASCPNAYVSVNLSPQQFDDGRIIDQVASLLATLRTRGLAEALRLEVTESGVFRDQVRAVHAMKSLRSAGARIVLDDFGVGYSSLSHLAELPLDAVKLDRSFINRITDEPRQLALVRAMVAMADGVTMNLIAEGIEEQAQLDLLRKLGCPSGQGYFFSEPQPITTFADPTLPIAA
jgi:diguanylate cyclase (GGDEF)-like protein